MGNQPSKDIDIFANLKPIKKDHLGIILQHTSNHYTYLLKEHTFSDDKHYEQERSRVQRQIEIPKNQHILRIQKINTHTIQGLCSTTHKLYVLYEYPQVTLEDQIIARKKEHILFDQNQLWSILQSCCNALPNLKPTMSINTSLIFPTHDGTLKLIHNDLFDQNYRYCIDPKYYYAPQKIINFNKLDCQNSLAKQVVFSLGMTLLQVALLQPKMDECYDFKKQLFLETPIEYGLMKLKQNYCSQFIEIVQMMLRSDPSERPSFTQLQELLKKHWESTDQSLSNENDSVKIGQEQVLRRLITVESTNNDKILQPTNPNNLVLNPSSSSKGKLPINKISQSIQSDQQAQKCQQTLSLKQSIPHHPQNKQNIYTDPKLLEMIKQDLNDIHQLKQSTLKQTIKYSFLYSSDSIFKSIQDVKLSPKPAKTPSPHNTSSKTLDHNNQYSSFIDEDGHQYEGYVFNNKKHGKGKLIFQDGAYYQGQFKNGQIEGKGILYYQKNKPAYEGTWLNGQFHGQGTLYNENPISLSQPFNYTDFDQIEEYWVKYQGEFNQDTKCGVGKLFLTNGQTIEGLFENDLINGQCLYTTQQGTSFSGIWQLNRLVHLYQQ